MTTQRLQVVLASVILFILLVGVIISQMRGTAQKNMGGPQETSLPITTSAPTTVVVKNKVAIGTMRLEAAQPSLTVGKSGPMQVTLSAPGKSIDGADAVIRFDPALLTVSGITNGSYFRELIRSTIDVKQGLIKVTGFAPTQQGVLAETVPFFTFQVTAKKAGEAMIQVMYDPERSDESTIVEKGTSKNLLTDVVNVRVSIAP